LPPDPARGPVTITRRSLAGLAADAAFVPAFAAAQAWTPRRTGTCAEGFRAAGRRPRADQVPTLRVGLPGGANEADRLGRFSAHRDLRERTSGLPTRPVPVSDQAGVPQAFGAQQIEVAGLGAPATILGVVGAGGIGL
jgi:phosphonate transport system substrate-binding protein